MKNLLILLSLCFLAIACTDETEQLIKEAGADEITELTFYNYPNQQQVKGQVVLAPHSISLEKIQGDVDKGQLSWGNAINLTKADGAPIEEQFQKPVLKQISQAKLHLGDIAEYTRKKHQQAIYEFTKVEFNFQPEGTTIRYHYELENGSLQTLMVAYQYQNTKEPPSLSYTIDCSGACGCLEQYNVRTGHYNCSCDDCNMSYIINP